jgi:hypothetical protein
MRRFTILQGHSGTFAVVDTSRPDYIRHVCRGTEAEASICAFALNAVAEDGTLESKRIVGRTGEPPYDGNVPHGTAIFEITTYDGPLLDSDKSTTGDQT